MTHIVQGAETLTLINTFVVEPGKQAELIELLEEATRTVMRHQPGFVSASFHISLDGQHVANYAQWRSRQDFEAMQADPTCREHMQKAAALARSFEPLLYRVASVHEA